MNIRCQEKLDTFYSRGCITRAGLTQLAEDLYNMGFEDGQAITAGDGFLDLMKYVLRISRNDPTDGAVGEFWVITSISHQQYRGSTLIEALDNFYKAEFTEERNG